MEYKKGITVIVPVYNSEKTIRKCIDSIVEQNYKAWRLILVDDGSKDKSSTICDEYAEKYDNIDVFHIENDGVSNARNLGMSKVETEYFVFVDSDDFVKSDYLLCLAEIKDKHPNAGHYWCCFETDTNGQKRLYLSSNTDDISAYSKNQIMTLHKLWIAQAPFCKLYNTNVVHSNNLKMNTEYSLGEDLMFNLDYLNSVGGDEIIILNKALYVYVLGNSESLDNKYRSNLEEIYEYLNNYILKYLDKWSAEKSQYKLFHNMEFNCLENILENEMNKKNKISFFHKIKNNNERLSSEKYGEVINNAEGYVHPLLLKAYRSKNYIFIVAFNKLVKFKSLLRG